MKIHVAFCLKVGTLHEESIICSFGSNMHLPSYHLGNQWDFRIFFPVKGLRTWTSTGLRGLKFIFISTQMLYHQILDIPIEQKCLQAWLLLPAIHIHPFPTYHGGHSLAIVFLSSTPPNSVAIQKTPMWQSPHHGQNIWTKCHHRWIISENCFIRIFLKQQAGVRGLFFGNSC